MEYDKCHCGAWTMEFFDDPNKDLFNASLRFGYCYDCATSRCDTSDGMLAGCPNESIR